MSLNSFGQASIVFLVLYSMSETARRIFLLTNISSYSFLFPDFSLCNEEICMEKSMDTATLPRHCASGCPECGNCIRCDRVFGYWAPYCLFDPVCRGKHEYIHCGAIMLSGSLGILYSDAVWTTRFSILASCLPPRPSFVARSKGRYTKCGKESIKCFIPSRRCA